ncbi:pyridoxal phosphate-dependent aminotransferase [Candidatus Nitrospira allomarina]|jgi:aspartate aminotransferase|uniref:Aminotransferase n=1 Tax=Candidatus Nitrospira allomarina TaxID=3020900 RepID=A0AA96GE84_9BACT|nr:pyridoxal phosphate-dependent aminotransferase [Candidatus Nitrospira allomarina]WNM57273.1 pyridoxal phosphate-dependent aminotransferase [Candidatus Nitrospira allomarina]
MNLASRTTRITPSPTLQLSATVKALIAQGQQVFDFTAGEPSLDSPEEAKEAAFQAIRSGFTKYTAVTGIDDLKEAIIEKFQRDQGLTYSKSQILVSCGAKHTLFNLALALFEAGDEVIIPAPYWVSYPEQILVADAKPVILPTSESSGYAIDVKALESVVSDRTKAIILNSPCNPTGSMYDRKTLEGIAQIALQHDLLIISDEIYEKMVYDRHQHYSIASLGTDIAKNTIIVNGVSKTYSMTGWRIGYAAGPETLIKAMGDIQSQSTSNPSSISQKAAIGAIRGADAFIEHMVKELDMRRTAIVEGLNRIPGIHCPMPAGAFYAFPSVAQLLGRRFKGESLSTPLAFANFFLKEAQVACVPGEPFGSPTHLRFSYTGTLEVIEEGLQHLTEAVAKLE